MAEAKSKASKEKSSKRARSLSRTRSINKTQSSRKTPLDLERQAREAEAASQHLDQKLESLNTAFTERANRALTRSAMIAGGDLRSTLQRLSTRSRSENKGPGVSLSNLQEGLSQVQNTSSKPTERIVGIVTEVPKPKPRKAWTASGTTSSTGAATFRHQAEVHHSFGERTPEQVATSATGGSILDREHRRLYPQGIHANQTPPREGLELVADIAEDLEGLLPSGVSPTAYSAVALSKTQNMPPSYKLIGLQASIVSNEPIHSTPKDEDQEVISPLDISCEISPLPLETYKEIVEFLDYPETKQSKVVASVGDPQPSTVSQQQEPAEKQSQATSMQPKSGNITSSAELNLYLTPSLQVIEAEERFRRAEEAAEADLGRPLSRRKPKRTVLQGPSSTVTAGSLRGSVQYQSYWGDGAQRDSVESQLIEADSDTLQGILKEGIDTPSIRGSGHSSLKSLSPELARLEVNQQAGGSRDPKSDSDKVRETLGLVKEHL